MNTSLTIEVIEQLDGTRLPDMRIEMNDKPGNSEEIPANAFGQLVSYLPTRGYIPADIIGTSATGRSRQEVFEAIKEVLGWQDTTY